MAVELVEFITILLGSVVACISLFLFLWTRFTKWTQTPEGGPRIQMAAMHAVRAAELTVVRPILCERMTDTVVDMVNQYPQVTNPLQFRALLFCFLLRRMHLTDAEHAHARQVATEKLVAEIQSMHAPPLRLNMPQDTVKHEAALQLAIEGACLTRHRASSVLLHQFSLFCGGNVSESFPDFVEPSDTCRSSTVDIPKDSFLLL